MSTLQNKGPNRINLNSWVFKRDCLLIIRDIHLGRIRTLSPATTGCRSRTSSISWFICGTQGCHILSKGSRHRWFFTLSRHPGAGAAAAAAGGCCLHGRHPLPPDASSLLDLIRWLFFNYSPEFLLLTRKMDFYLAEISPKGLFI